MKGHFIKMDFWLRIGSHIFCKKAEKKSKTAMDNYKNPILKISPRVSISETDIEFVSIRPSITCRGCKLRSATR
jgi:hypothetical protein